MFTKKLHENDHLEELGTGGEMILKSVSQKYVGEYLAEMSWFSIRGVAIK